MPIVELYENPYKGEVDIYDYDYLPKPLRVQVFLLIQKFSDWQLDSKDINNSVVDDLCSKYGVLNLKDLDIFSIDEDKETPGRSVQWQPKNFGYRNYKRELENFFLCRKETQHDLRAIKFAFEFICKYADKHPEWNYIQATTASRRVLLAIEELNTKFKQHRIGYEFSNNSFRHIDSQFVHSEVVKPALNLLTDPDYSGAQEEFAKAHSYHLEGDATAALNECNKSLESVLKIICAKRKWQHDSSDGFGKLLEKVTEKGLIPKHWNTLFPALNNLLAGVSKARNELSGHGRGSQEAVSIPPHVAAYAMHMTAAAILFLVTAEKECRTI